MAVYAIYAQGENGEFGFMGKLPPWDCPADREFFRVYTLGAAVIMGSTTAKSLKRPLRDRINIIVTSKPPNKLKRIWRAFKYHEIYCSNLQDALDIGQEMNDNVFVIGGKDIIMEALPACDAVLRTVISGTYPADLFMSDLPSEWVRMSENPVAGATCELWVPGAELLRQVLINEASPEQGEVC